MMKKVALVAVLALGLGMVAPQMAEAKDMQGRFGVGADSSLGWSVADPSSGSVARVDNTGLSLVYYISKMFGLQLMVSSVITTGSIEDATGQSVDGFAQRTGVSVRGIIPIAFTNEVNLGAVIGFSGIFGSGDQFTETGDDDAEPLFISFDLGLRPEWFITDHFSIHTQIGLAISLLNDTNFGAGAADASGVTIDIFGNADLLGNAGFTFWF